MSNIYYWLEENKDILAKNLMEKVMQFQSYAVNSGQAQSWQMNKDFYENRYYSDYEAIDILNVGEQGELLATAAGHYRNILRHMLNPIVSVPVSFTVSAVNGSVSARRNAKIGKQVNEYYQKVKRAEDVLNDATEYGVVYGSGFYVCEWNPELGKQVRDEKTGKLKKEGDFDEEALSVFDVFYDFTRKTKSDWVIFRRKRNKYDIAASFEGEKKERIENLDCFYAGDLYYKNVDSNNLFETDDIYIYSAYHRATPAIPEGKYVLFCGQGESVVHLYDNFNIYKEQLPAFAMQPGRYLELGFGYTDANMLRAPQMLLNSAMSSLATNAEKAVNMVWCQAGDEVSTESVASGNTLIQSKTKPEVFSLMGDNTGLINLIMMMKNQMETLSAQNAVVRGDVASAPQLKSGVALQTVVAMGQQFSHGLQSARNRCFEDVATFRLRTLEKLSDAERVIEIVGRSNKVDVVSFTGENLKDAVKVVVEQVNPILNTPAGRIELAQQYMELSQGAFSWTDFLDVVNTGNLQQTQESDQAMNNYTEQVKEALLDGKPVMAIMGTNHKQLIKEVQSLLLNLDFTLDNANSEIIQNITRFLTESMDLMRNGDEVSNLIYGGQAPTPAAVPMEQQAMEASISQGAMGTPQPEGVI